MSDLVWKEAERLRVLPDIPCFEAEAKDGRYRVAPWLSTDRKVGYEATFIPAGAKSMADVRDIAGSAEQGSKGLLSIDDARTAAERDFQSC